MPFLQETPGALRAYFILIGVIGALVNVPGLMSGSGVAVVISALGFCLSLAYVYIGIRLKQLLSTAPQRIIQVLVVGLCYLGVVALLNLLVGVWAVAIQLVFGVLLTLYLTKNVGRLSTAPTAPAQTA